VSGGLTLTEGLVGGFGWGLAYQDFLDVATPAAGANAPVKIGGENRVRVVAALATLTTDANAANRFLSLDFIDARGVTRIRNGAGLVVTANTSAQAFVWERSRTVGEWAANTPVFLALSSLFLEPGFTVQFTVDNKQVGDTLTALTLVLERFPTGPKGYPEGMVTDRG
jgi:hypothetical protein